MQDTSLRPGPPAEPDPGAGSGRPRAAPALPIVTGLAVALAILVVFLLARGAPTGGPGLEHALLDEDVVRLAAEELVRRSGGVWDAFPDPDVGRVLQRDLDRRRTGHIEVSSNGLGLREREFELPKPAGLVRIVLLGDSFVFGSGVDEDERLGVCLERHLRDRARAPVGALEVLHVGIVDWNILAETSFVRRQLSALQPDLVIHVLIQNDLDDMSGVRGFGAMAGFCPQTRDRADTFVSTRQPYVLGFGKSPAGQSLLTAGLDGESRERYGRAAAEMRRLEGALAARGAGYLALLFWPRHTAAAQRELMSFLDEDQRTYLPRELHGAQRWSVSAIDAHWNPAALERISRQLYSLLQRRELLPALDLAPWPEADQAADAWHEAGRLQAQEPREAAALLGGQAVETAIDFGALSEGTAAQVHGGVSVEGIVAPYASMILANRDATELVLEIRPTERPELDGTTAVFLDEIEIDRWPQPVGAPRERRYPIPDALVDRPFLSLRFESSDFAYRGPDLRRSVALRLDRVALE